MLTRPTCFSSSRNSRNSCARRWEAIKGINIDKVTVWDNGGQSADGKGSTANFVSGLLKSVPPLADLFDQAGMSLPEYLGKRNQSSENETAEAEEV